MQFFTLADHIIFVALVFVLPVFALARVKSQARHIPKDQRVKIQLYWHDFSAFSSLIQGWMVRKNKGIDSVLLLMSSILLFQPKWVYKLLDLRVLSYEWIYPAGAMLFVLVLLIQKQRVQERGI